MLKTYRVFCARSADALAISLLLIASAAASGAERLYTNQPAITPSLAQAGEWPVGARTITLDNPNQLDANDLPNVTTRRLVIEMWYPAADTSGASRAEYRDVTRLHKPFTVLGDAWRDATPVEGESFPLVVLSHGYTGYRTIMYYLGEHLASHGYVVASIDHPDSTNAAIDFVNNRGAGFASTLLHRARDQQFVLDTIAELDSPVTAIADAERASVIGYSMGGYGAVNVVGGCYRYTREVVLSFGVPEAAADALVPVYSGCSAWRDAVDPRWKAMVAFAPWGQTRGVHDLGGVELPSLFIAGEEDDVSGFADGVRDLYEQAASDDKYLLVYEGARHNIAPHPAPSVAYESADDLGHYAEPAWSVEQLNRVNKHMVLAFLDCHVKAADERCEYLPRREVATQVRGGDGQLSEPWPGFGDRWATGMRFYRGSN